ncbi:MAG TPA: RNA polymerase sigma factor RpoD, partial [Ottowia sp.]|nr:RNA polymerase sigma factor RpoD [Ottowia sp.]HRL66954.1 RNA polymerase sigma factor RpoD [Ottowia sp.]
MPTSQKPAAKSVPAKAAAKPAAKSAARKTAAPDEVEELSTKKAAAPAKKAGRPAKGAAAAEKSTPAKRGRPGKAGAKEVEDEDLSDIEADLEGEPGAEAAPAEGVVEKVKPLRMKISKAKERA